MKLSVKKMVRSGDHHDGQVLRPRPIEYIGQRYRVILLTMDQQGICGNLRQQPLARRAADQYQPLSGPVLLLKTFLQLRLHEGAE